MKTRISLNTFRKVGRLEENMMRATMPRTSDRDVEPLAPFAGRPEINVLARRAGVNLVKPLTATLAEVARGLTGTLFCEGLPTRERPVVVGRLRHGRAPIR